MADFPPPLPLDPIVLDPTPITVSPLLLVYAVGLIILAALFIYAVAYLRSMPPKGRTRRATHAAGGGSDASPEASDPPFSNLLGKH